MKDWIYSIPDEPTGYRDRLADRILARATESANGCLEWQGFVTSRGYGQCYVTVNRVTRRTQPHRAIWLASVGDIKFGHEVDHLCGNTICVNVDHLEPVLHDENVYRANGRGRKKSPEDCSCSVHGRENGYVYWAPKGYWVWKCRVCRNAHLSKYRGKEYQ